MVQSLWKTVVSYEVKRIIPLLGIHRSLLCGMQQWVFVLSRLLLGDAMFVLLSFICFSLFPQITRLSVSSCAFPSSSFLMVSKLLISKLSL